MTTITQDAQASSQCHQPAGIANMTQTSEATYTLFSVGKGKKRTYALKYDDSEEVWIDMKYLPQSTFLCACCDNIAMSIVNLKKEKRYFLPSSWLINDWGGDSEYVEVIKSIREKFKNYKPEDNHD